MDDHLLRRVPTWALATLATVLGAALAAGLL